MRAWPFAHARYVLPNAARFGIHHWYMRVLLTNDDGIESGGLKVLLEMLEGEHEVWVVAPDGERSGCAQAITISTSIMTRKTGERMFACSGTPVDCVNLAKNELMSAPPDLVISGINLGPNIGTDIGYSGTAAAARQGAYFEIPSIALSVFGYRPGLCFGAALHFLREHMDALIEGWKKDFFYNINTPNTDNRVEEIVVCDIADVKYTSGTVSFDAPRGDRYHFYEGSLITDGVLPGTDLYAVMEGKISVSYVRSIPAVTVAPGSPFPPPE